MIRVCKDRKMKYQSLGISILPKYWDFKANKPTSKCPNKEYIERLIAEKVKVYTCLLYTSRSGSGSGMSSCPVLKTAPALGTRPVDRPA